ncbi:MAG: hypothetical protein SGI92_30530 [Bryobacteraceae bacterium]|nr:hypothetical protein [Bryobacteraceae bacterium]
MADDQSSNDSALERAARTVGSAAGKVANLAGVEPVSPVKKREKFPKQNKVRLPRRMKKAQKKADGKL